MPIQVISAWSLIGILVLAAPIYGVCSTAPVAVDDFLRLGAAPTLLDVLANDSDLEGQALSLSVLSSNCPGQVEVDGGLIVVDPGGPLLAPCTISYEVRDETGDFAVGTVTVTSSTNIFSDDFESGSTQAWSACDPSC